MRKNIILILIFLGLFLIGLGVIFNKVDKNIDGEYHCEYYSKSKITGRVENIYQNYTITTTYEFTIKDNIISNSKLIYIYDFASKEFMDVFNDIIPYTKYKEDRNDDSLKITKSYDRSIDKLSISGKDVDTPQAADSALKALKKAGYACKKYND